MKKRNYTKAYGGRRTVKRRKLLIAVALLVSVYFFASLLFGEMGIIKYYRMKSRHGALTERMAELKQDNVRLIREVTALKTDPAYIELRARDMLGLARPGEMIYYYSEPLKGRQD
ncbi:MAG TPA: hypothetical protein DCO77_03185 [Nitrospiraceae bacterium]|nr:hypothetical protein [Nitrospiraceae bacterium]